jgi:capsular exopolysaccharide synthesis family protein
LSKIYEALKKAEQDRERRQSWSPLRARPTGDAAESGSATQEEYQKLRASLISIAVPAGLHTVLVTAPRHGEGATTVAVGLAGALAADRTCRVLLVEANLRTPSFGTILPLTADAGLVDLAGGHATPESLVSRPDGVGFSAIGAGDRRGQMIDLDVVDTLLARLRPQFDFIVVDGPPVNIYADSSMLATKVDGVILVVEADQTPVVEAEAANRQLTKVGARILGVVLNRRRSYIPAFLESIL